MVGSKLQLCDGPDAIPSAALFQELWKRKPVLVGLFAQTKLVSP